MACSEEPASGSDRPDDIKIVRVSEAHQMATVYSTLDIHPRERLSYWLDVATKAFVRHEFHSSTGPSFTGALRGGPLAGLGVATVECDPCEVGRTALDIARDHCDDLLVCLQQAGTVVFVQDGRRAVNERGSFVLLDTRRPYTQVFQTHTKTMVVKVPRQMLEARLGSVAPLTARTMEADNPIAGLASGFLSMLPGRLDTLDGPVGVTIAEQALDLVALAFSVETQQSASSLSSSRAITLLRLKSIIESRLYEPDLRPAAVAAEAGISIRYANALLSAEGTSLERCILDRRLERCRRALEDPRQAHRTIGEIAFAWGFSDLSHFGRRFKAAFGVPPGEYRRQEK
jgi:AraC family transcriptional regulator, positive regulator of tynA and feaB